MRKYAIVLFCLCAVAAGAEEVREVAYHGDIKGYLALPDNAKDAPGLILIHEWWGLNDDIRTKAREFASDGYVALAVDLYKGESTDKAAMARRLAGGVQKNQNEAFANLRSAAAF